MHKFSVRMYSIGYDIGSADIKLALVNNSTAEVIDVINTNDRELDIIAKQNGWAEQDPEIWWQLVCKGTKQLISKHKLKASDIVSIGISYQMHGLVLVDENLQVLRPAIIWSDNRAVPLGKAAFQESKIMNHITMLRFIKSCSLVIILPCVFQMK